MERNQESKDHNEHVYDQISSEEKQFSKGFAVIFTIIFTPLCLFATSYYIAEQFNEKGASYIEYDMYEEAIKYYRKSVFFNRKYIDSWNWLGYSYKVLHDYEKAIDAYGNTLRLDPQNYNANYNTAMSYALKGDYKNAIPSFERLREIVINSDKLDRKSKQKNLESITNLIATCYKRLGKSDSAKTGKMESPKQEP